MSQVEVDIEALKAWREALLTFINQQKEALEVTEREITMTITMLDEAERYWYFQVEERGRYLEQCEREAARAAEAGYSIDCSACVYALQEAQEQLAHIRQWQRQVDEEIHVYQRQKQHIAYLLESDTWQALTFLDHRIKALEVYYGTRVSSSASISLEVASLVDTGIATVINSVIRAVGSSQPELSTAIGSVGEEIAAQVLSQRFGLKAMPSPPLQHGFKRVFTAPGMPLMVMESQVKEGIPEQDMSKHLARLVQESDAEETPTVAVVTDPVRGLADMYTRKDGGDWQLLSSGKDIHRILPELSQGQIMPHEQREDYQDSTEEKV